MRHGVSAALVANINRDRKDRPKPYVAADFIHWRDVARPDDNDEPVLLDDPKAQSDLIASLFGVVPQQPAE